MSVLQQHAPYHTKSPHELILHKYLVQDAVQASDYNASDAKEAGDLQGVRTLIIRSCTRQPASERYATHPSCGAQ